MRSAKLALVARDPTGVTVAWRRLKHVTAPE